MSLLEICIARILSYKAEHLNIEELKKTFEIILAFLFALWQGKNFIDYLKTKLKEAILQVFFQKYQGFYLQKFFVEKILGKNMASKISQTL